MSGTNNALTIALNRAVVAETKVKQAMPVVNVMASMIKDVELNMRTFLIPQGKINKDSIFAVEFYKKYYLLFPKDKPNDPNEKQSSNNKA